MYLHKFGHFSSWDIIRSFSIYALITNFSLRNSCVGCLHLDADCVVNKFIIKKSRNLACDNGPVADDLSGEFAVQPARSIFEPDARGKTILE